MPSTIDFSNTKILVIGDIMLDRYISGEAIGLSPEAPVPVIKVQRKLECWVELLM